MKIFRNILIITDLFLGLSACIGGILLIADPSGNVLEIIQGNNDSGPIHDFTFPGLLLFFIIGIPGVISASMLKRRRPQALRISFSFNLLLCGWLIMQMIFLPGYGGLSMLYLVLGIISLLISMQLSGKLAM